MLPIFALLLFAVIDFGLAFGGMISLRSDVNAGARLASVSQTDPSCSTAANPMICTIDDRIGSLPGVQSGSLQVGVALPDGLTAGDNVVVCAQATLQSTSGITSTFLNGRTVHVSSELRLEQDAGYSAGGLAC